MNAATKLALAAGAAVLGAAWWWRKNPSACPYGQRFWVEAPHPFITRSRLLAALNPQPGERILEVGPGTGYYTLEVAKRLEPDGRLDIFDLQYEMLDHTIGRARDAQLSSVFPIQGDARALSYPYESFDAAFLVTVLGEVRDQDKALGELHRVLKPDGRLVVGELLGDPHYVTPSALERRAQTAGLRLRGRRGTWFGYFAVFDKEPAARDT
jgi:ubiquinone/menaquinone biosynthesis C-methylase UbiE